MQVRTQQYSEEFERYANFGHEVYRERPYRVPPDTHYLISLLSGEAATSSHTRFQAFWVESAGVGKRSCFQVLLPIEQGTSLTAASTEASRGVN